MSGWDDDGAQPAREIKRGIRAVHVLGFLGTCGAIALGVHFALKSREPAAPVAEAAPIVTIEKKVPAYAGLVREAGPVDIEPPEQLDRLHLRASAPVMAVVVNARTEKIPSPMTHVSVVLERDELTAPFKIEVIAVDGRRWSKAGVVATALPIEVPFAGLPAGLSSTCVDGHAFDGANSLFHLEDGPEMGFPPVRAVIDKKGRFRVWHSTGKTAGTFGGTYSGEGYHQLESAVRGPLTTLLPAENTHHSKLRRLSINSTFAIFAANADLPAPWRAALEATDDLTDIAPEVPWGAVGIEVARDGKSAKLVHRGCKPVAVNMISAELRAAQESSTTALVSKSWSGKPGDFVRDGVFDLAAGASRPLPFGGDFAPEPGERVVVRLKTKMRMNLFSSRYGTWVDIEIEGASSL